MEIESQDVIRLVLQFLKENNLSDSMKTLQKESGVALNTVDNIDTFTNDIKNGKWDSVLTQSSHLKLSRDKMSSLYEQIILELLEVGERDLAKEILRTSDPMIQLKSDNPNRYLQLELFCKRPFFSSSDAYDMGTSKESRRHEIAALLSSEVSVAPPSRLLALLSQAIKYQQSMGLLPDDGLSSCYDLFKGKKKLAKKDAEDKIVKTVSGAITLEAKSSKIDCSVVSPDGQMVVTGSSDGYIEVWDVDSGRLRTDLSYQEKNELMMQEGAVTCCAFARDSDHFATGSLAGHVKVWKVSTGVCVRKLTQAHPQGITSLSFARDGTQLLTTSYDQTARIHGLKSGKTLKEFRGHTSYVTTGSYFRGNDSNFILTASVDGTVKQWDVRSTECVMTCRPGFLPGAVVAVETAVVAALQMPSPSTDIFVCTKSRSAFLVSQGGLVVRRFSADSDSAIPAGDFVCAALSPQGKFAYCVTETGTMCVFDTRTGELEHSVSLVKAGTAATQTRTGAVNNIWHHPFRNLVGLLETSGTIKLWKP